jgi:hypothetical protein
MPAESRIASPIERIRDAAEAVEAKFRDCAQGVFPRERSEAVLRQLSHLVDLPAVAPLCEVLEASRTANAAPQADAPE